MPSPRLEVIELFTIVGLSIEFAVPSIKIPGPLKFVMAMLRIESAFKAPFAAEIVRPAPAGARLPSMVVVLAPSMTIPDRVIGGSAVVGKIVCTLNCTRQGKSCEQ